MMEENNNKQEVSLEELLVSNMLELEAVIQLLVEKGILTQGEILDKVKLMKSQMAERIKDNSKIN